MSVRDFCIQQAQEDAAEAPRTPGVAGSTGRPPVSEDVRLVQKTIRLSAKQWEKIDAAGGIEALRKLIDRWRPKKDE